MAVHPPFDVIYKIYPGRIGPEYGKKNPNKEIVT